MHHADANIVIIPHLFYYLIRNLHCQIGLGRVETHRKGHVVDFVDYVKLALRVCRARPA